MKHFATPLPELEKQADDLTKKVEAHLAKMGF
jgi:uncharacterized protein Yka (UPF0111/DUF47 family)